mgnify:FL=1
MRVFATLFLVTVLATAPAFAGPKPTLLGWWPSHWLSDPAQPYLEDGTTPHNRQWDKKTWRMHDWTSKHENDKELIYGFYEAGILVKQSTWRGVPALYVGAAFHDLSGFDKRRVVETVNHVYGITERNPNAVFYIYDTSRRMIIGMYTLDGLSLQ